jgi:GNAT superfamily N-acetyltransferase
MDIEYRLASTEHDVRACYPVMAELRMNLSESQFMQQVAKQRLQGYQLLMAYTKNSPLVMVGVAGFVLGYKLAWGKHLYLDDLTTLEGYRNLGVGKGMIDWLLQYGKTNGCAAMHLDSGVQRFAAHKFYFRENFHIASHHFCLKL